MERQSLPGAAADVPPAAQAVAPAWAPSVRLQLTNFVLFQLGWFAAVLGAAHGHPLAGTAVILAVVAWHLAVSARPAVEARLVAAVSAIGFVVETGMVWLGHVRYPSGQPVAALPPYWMVALWALFAVALNVTMRWLRGRAWLAAALGAVAGPMAFAGGVRLGGAHFVDASSALLALAVAWGLLMPLLMRLAVRFDGVTVFAPAAAAGQPTAAPPPPGADLPWGRSRPTEKP
jgi:hypothetical protein